MDATTLIIWVIAWSFGAGYFIYWKNQQKGMPMICGIILCIYPYFTDNILILLGVGITLVVLPFLLRF